MNLWNKIKGALRWGVQDDTTQTARVIVLGQTTAGVSVNPDNALMVSAVWACVTYLSRTVAQLPWRVMQEMGEQAPRRAYTHPVQYLLQTRANRETSAFVFRETIVGWACRRGNGVAEIERDNRGVPTGLFLIHPDRVTFGRDADTGELLYTISATDGTQRTLGADNVFHVRGFGEGAVGLDVMSYAAESIGWARATELFGAAFFGNGANPSGFIKYPGKLSPGAKSVLDAELSSKHGGPKKANRTMVLDGGMDYVKSGVEPDSAQFIETRQHQVEEICRWFGVPPHKIMHMLRSTFSNIEHQSIEVVVDSITPWAMRIEQEADYKLFRRRSGFFTKMDLKGLLRGDFKSRQEGLQIMRRNGVVSANEWRRLEDMNEIGAEGDKYAIEANMTTLAQLGEQPPEAQDPAPLLALAREQLARVH